MSCARELPRGDDGGGDGGGGKGWLGIESVSMPPKTSNRRSPAEAGAARMGGAGAARAFAALRGACFVF